MNGLEVLDVARGALVVALKMTTPLLLAALVIGILVSLLQALTQVQEFTLSFIPKVISIFLLLFLLLPLYGDIFQVFVHGLFDKIVSVPHDSYLSGD